jgi:hypothetical protein
MMNSKPQERPERNYQLHVPADFTSRESDPGSQWTNNERVPKPVQWTDYFLPIQKSNTVRPVPKQSDHRHAQSSGNSQPTALSHNPTVTCFIYKHAYIYVYVYNVIINSWTPVTTRLFIIGCGQNIRDKNVRVQIRLILRNPQIQHVNCWTFSTSCISWTLVQFIIRKMKTLPPYVGSVT